MNQDFDRTLFRQPTRYADVESLVPKAAYAMATLTRPTKADINWKRCRKQIAKMVHDLMEQLVSGLSARLLTYGGAGCLGSRIRTPYERFAATGSPLGVDRVVVCDKRDGWGHHDFGRNRDFW